MSCHSLRRDDPSAGERGQYGVDACRSIRRDMGMAAGPAASPLRRGAPHASRGAAGSSDQLQGLRLLLLQHVSDVKELAAGTGQDGSSDTDSEPDSPGAWGSPRLAGRTRAPTPAERVTPTVISYRVWGGHVVLLLLSVAWRGVKRGMPHAPAAP